jgi:hypothetical protein
MSPGEGIAANTGPTPQPPGGTQPLGPGPFVGRDNELVQLRAGLEAALRGQAGRIWILGGPGVGKTRLAEELACYCRLRGAAVQYVNAAQLVADPGRAAARVQGAAPGLAVVDAAEQIGVARVGAAARTLERSAVFVLLTARCQALEAELEAEEQILLPPLGVEEVARMISALWNRRVSSSLAQRALRETGGNPAAVRNWVLRGAQSASSGLTS